MSPYNILKYGFGKSVIISIYNEKTLGTLQNFEIITFWTPLSQLVVWAKQYFHLMLVSNLIWNPVFYDQSWRDITQPRGSFLAAIKQETWS